MGILLSISTIYFHFSRNVELTELSRKHRKPTKLDVSFVMNFNFDTQIVFLKNRLQLTYLRDCVFGGGPSKCFGICFGNGMIAVQNKQINMNIFAQFIRAVGVSFSRSEQWF